MESVYYVGMDVHKDSVRIAILKDYEKQTIYEATVNNDIPKIIKIMKKHQLTGKVMAGYEAGCMGYTLQRSLASMNIDCRVIAPNKIPRIGTERIKTDTRDAVLIARMLKNNEGDSIHVPTSEDEATRDLLRCREDLQAELQRIKHQLAKFLMRIGLVYPSEQRAWTLVHKKWMKSLTFSQPLQKECFDEYYCHMEEMENRLERIETRIVEVAQTEAYDKRVAQLRCFKGIDYLIALSLICEVGDFRRFPKASSFMAYLGLVPSEHSSGGKRRQGGITKTGNSHLRKLLIEASWHYRHRGLASATLKARRVGMNEFMIGYADKALYRLQKKFLHLIFIGKSSKTAVAAIARELSGFIWGAMTESYC